MLLYYNIDELVSHFERGGNHIFHNFSMNDSFTPKHIFSKYCERFYGCEFFNLIIYVKIVYFMVENYKLYFPIVSKNS